MIRIGAFHRIHYNGKNRKWEPDSGSVFKKDAFWSGFVIEWNMDIVFFGLLAVGIGVELFTKGGDAVLASLIAGTQSAVQNGITMAGGMLFWMGLMGVLERTPLMAGLSKSLRPMLRFLFPDAKNAGDAIALNLSCNMLGLGNAATPYGLEAMRIMEAENPNKGVATDSMCVLLAVNASCLELFPATLLGLRQSFQSARPAAVVLPVLLSSACSTAVTVLLCRLCIRK